jgi:Amt family ammonium transporter
LKDQLDALSNTLDGSINSIDTVWISLATYLVFFMQSGFALLELGSVREKNAQNILLKNMLDITMGSVSFWLIGYGIAYGNHDDDQFVGRSNYGATSFNRSETHFRDWLFQWAFAGTCSTIVSGALAERTKLGLYAIFSVIMTTFIYPFVVKWTWGGGFLAQDGYEDFAGSGIVHLCGGTAAFWGAYFVGPRIGRFDPNTVENFAPHNIPFVVLGVFILWFGWYGFNCGSTLGATGDNLQLLSKVGMTTSIGGCAGGLSGFILDILWNEYCGEKDDELDPTHVPSLKLAIAPGLTNGLLAGLVSITAGCANVEPWAAFVIGALGGIFTTFISKTLLFFQVDDPLDATSVHGGSGLWGVISIALFHNDRGLFTEGRAHFLGIQVAAALCIIGWTSAWSIAIFGGAAKMGWLRVAPEVEAGGLDEWEHGGSAYHMKATDRIRTKTLRLKKSSERKASPLPAAKDDSSDSSSSDSSGKRRKRKHGKAGTRGHEDKPLVGGRSATAQVELEVVE